MNKLNTTSNTNETVSTANTLALQAQQLSDCLEKLDLILANQGQLKNIIVSQVSIISGNASSANDRGNDNANTAASV